jgi:hypothetical protein
MEQIKSAMRQAFHGLTDSSPQFVRHLRKYIPRIVVYPYRPIDGGHPVLRAVMTVDLAGVVPAANEIEGLPGLLKH